MGRPHDATEDHPGPVRPQLARGREVLVGVFPHAVALPLPLAGEPVGRGWLAERGAPDPRVSTQHLVFQRAGGQLFLVDLGSRNGTFVDGVRLRPHERVPLTDGARLRIGRALFVYRDGFLGSDQPSPPLGELVGPFGLREIAAALEAARRLHDPRARPCVRNVLLEGETGTGKELLARVVAGQLERAQPYVALNAAALPAGVFESQLFGYVPGAYSGSGKGSRGVLLEHERGAVFLDEIGELPLELQPKLLRFLQNREVPAVGATRAATADVLVIAATHRPLDDLAASGDFRSDLLARFDVRLELPPLRERAEDLYAIARRVSEVRGRRLEPELVEVEALERLALQPWARNVRELASALDRVAALAPDGALPLWAVERVLGPLEGAAQPLTHDVLQAALSAAGGNESAAARKLGITRGRLRRFLKKA